MPTTYNDQAYPHDAFNLPVPLALIVTSVAIIDQDDDGLIENGDTINGNTITRIYPGDTMTVDGITITGATLYTTGGGEFFVATDGSVLFDGTGTASTWVNTQGTIPVGSLAPICFLRGTRLRGENGDIPVEDLLVGDMLMTADHGLQPIRWIGRKSTCGQGRFAPVRIASGALGNARDLYVSQQHRMMLSGPDMDLMFGEAEVLAAAKHLVNGDTITVAPRQDVEYFHILLDRHEILFAEGCASESFYPGAHVMSADKPLRDELLALFPFESLRCRQVEP